MELQDKIVSGFERISEVFKTLLWKKSKIHGISPLQIQILIFVSEHLPELNNVSSLAKEYSITKATVSDAVKSLLAKGFVKKEYSSIDNRRFDLLLTNEGEILVKDLKTYSESVKKHLEKLSTKDNESIYKMMSSLIFDLHKSGVIEVQRTCYGCRFYEGNKNDNHYCNLLAQQLQSKEIRLDCKEYELA